MRILLASVGFMGALFMGGFLAYGQDTGQNRSLEPIVTMVEAEDGSILLAQDNGNQSQRRCGRRNNPPLSS